MNTNLIGTRENNMFILIDSTYLNVSNIVSFKKAKCGDTWRLEIETTSNEIKRFDTKQKETFDQWCCQLPIYACERPENDLEEQKVLNTLFRIYDLAVHNGTKLALGLGEDYKFVRSRVERLYDERKKGL